MGKAKTATCACVLSRCHRGIRSPYPIPVPETETSIHYITTPPTLYYLKQSKRSNRERLPPSNMKLPSSETETQLNAASGKHPSPDDSDTFYIKLTDLLDSSGLSLIFNVRETLLDLYLFYLEVTRRGGYHQVGREKKWGEVVSALKLEGSNVKLSAQVEKLYAHLLYQFEQLYFYRAPAKQAAAPSSIQGPPPLKRKWDSAASLSQLMDIKDRQMVTEMCKDHHSCQMTGAAFVEQQVVLPAPSNGKETKKRRGAPHGQRNAYQIFLKQECARLKTCGPVPDGPGILRTAIDAWKKMSETEKQPYVEESKKSREKFKEAMITQSKEQNTMEGKRPSLCGDYHVTLQPEADNSLVNKAAVGLALKMTEKAPKDPFIPCEWDPIIH